MTARAKEAIRDERLDLLDPVIYADTFDCAVTLDELWRYGRTAIDRKALRLRLRDDPSLSGIVVERDGLYCLADRPALLEERRKRLDRAQILQRRARRVARVLRHAPFVRGLVLTGSAAADDAAADADVDLLVVVAPARLGIAFLLLASASRLLGRRLFCPNYYLCEDSLDLAPSNLYVARELAQARSIVGDGEALRSANPWLADVFPNVVTPPRLDSGLPVGRRLQRLLEAPLRGAFGDRLEHRARRVAAVRLRAHHRGLGQEVPADVTASFDASVSLRFHGSRLDEITLDRYAARREQVAGWLEQGDGSQEPRLVRSARP